MPLLIILIPLLLLALANLQDKSNQPNDNKKFLQEMVIALQKTPTTVV